jgi:hypothetical protein
MSLQAAKNKTAQLQDGKALRRANYRKKKADHTDLQRVFLSRYLWNTTTTACPVEDSALQLGSSCALVVENERKFPGDRAGVRVIGFEFSNAALERVLNPTVRLDHVNVLVRAILTFLY